MSTLFFLHGFLSNPDSQKARETRRWFAHHHPSVSVKCPNIPAKPGLAWRQLHDVIADCPDRVALIGSSLGGFYASCLSQALQCPAVLINPLVWTPAAAARFAGTHAHDDGSEVFIDADDIAVLQGLAAAKLNAPERLKIYLQTGDETLDYRDAESFYKACTLALESGGSHRFDGYQRYLPAIARHLGLS